MLRVLLPLIAAAMVPLLLAPPTEGCGQCQIRALSIPLSLEQGLGSWHELELQPKTRYTLRLDTLSGESSVELFSLSPKAPLGDLKCSGDTKTQSCTFRAAAHGLLGVYVEPKTRVTDAIIELSGRD